MNELALLEAILAELVLMNSRLLQLLTTPYLEKEAVNAQTDKPAATKPANRPTKAKG